MSTTNRDYTKTWIPGGSRGTQTFNAPSTLNIPYGRYKGTISGRGGSGNVPNASAWATNYNTNYNTAYPIANQPITAYITNYNTNYNTVYPVANRPIANQPATGTNPPTYYYRQQSNWFSQYTWPPGGPTQPQKGYWGAQGFGEGCPGSWVQQYVNNTTYGHVFQDMNTTFFCYGPFPGNTNYTTNYNTNYNTAYPIANQPLANQPASAWATNYNTAYPVANRPIANQPITAYTPGNAGISTNVLGVTFPGGPIDTSAFPGGTPGTAPTVSPTDVSYNAYPDNASYPVAVPPGGQIVVKIE